MSPQNTNSDEIEKFTTTNRREIVFYLRQLVNDGERVSVVFNEGKETVLTVLLDVNDDGGHLIFDWGGSEIANRKLLQSDRCFFVCAPHGVKNQFMAGAVREAMYKGRPAFATRIPDHYTRLQRREFFRLVLPMTRRPPLTLRPEGGQPQQLSIVDLSIGGVAAELPDAALSFETGQKLMRASIELKGIGNLEVDLEVRNLVEIQRGAKVMRRIGCQFIKLSHAMENQLQRFITDVQREERARLGS